MSTDAAVSGLGRLQYKDPATGQTYDIATPYAKGDAGISDGQRATREGIQRILNSAPPHYKLFNRAQGTLWGLALGHALLYGWRAAAVTTVYKKIPNLAAKVATENVGDGLVSGYIIRMLTFTGVGDKSHTAAQESVAKQAARQVKRVQKFLFGWIDKTLKTPSMATYEAQCRMLTPWQMRRVNLACAIRASAFAVMTFKGIHFAIHWLDSQGGVPAGVYPEMPLRGVNTGSASHLPTLLSGVESWAKNTKVSHKSSGLTVWDIFFKIKNSEQLGLGDRVMGMVAGFVLAKPGNLRAEVMHRRMAVRYIDGGSGLLPAGPLRGLIFKSPRLKHSLHEEAKWRVEVARHNAQFGSDDWRVFNNPRELRRALKDGWQPLNRRPAPPQAAAPPQASAPPLGA